MGGTKLFHAVLFTKGNTGVMEIVLQVCQAIAYKHYSTDALL